MRDKIAPWIPAGLCAVMAVIVTITNLWIYANGGSDGSATMIFVLFLPMCFYFVGAYLTQLRKENREILARFDEITRT